MNLVLTCPNCGSVFRVVEATDSMVGATSDYWPDKYTCALCGGSAQACEESALPRGMNTAGIIDLTSEELFMALEGLGLPTERTATLEAVNAAISHSPLHRIVGKDVPNIPRCVVDYLELVDGTRIYFGASSLGAICYRLVPPPARAQEVCLEGSV